MNQFVSLGNCPLETGRKEEELLAAKRVPPQGATCSGVKSNPAAGISGLANLGEDWLVRADTHYIERTKVHPLEL